MAFKTYSGTKKNDTYIIEGLGKENDVQAYVRASKGKDKVDLGNIDFKKLKFTQGKETVVTADGPKEVLSKDLIITYNENGKTGTILLENYFKNKNANSTASSFKTLVVSGTEYNISDLFDYNGPLSIKGSKVNGTVFNDNINMIDYTDKKQKGLTINAGAGNDTIVGSSYNDIIKAVSGTNTINGGRGNDKLYAGKGADKFQFEAAFGRDTIYSSNQMDSLEFNLADGYKLKYDKKGNNLVITTLDSKGTETDNTVTIANYFKQKEGSTIKLSESMKNIVLNTSNGTYFNDNIVGTYKVDKIVSGKGDDIITARGGNDIITLNGAGDKTINLFQDDGHDTIKVTADDVNIDLVYDARPLDFNSVEDYSGMCLDTWYYKHGNDLAVYRSYGESDGSDELHPKNVTTIKDYFNSQYEFTLSINGKDINDIFEDGEGYIVNEVIGNKNKSNNIVSDANYEENWLHGGNKNDVFTSSTSSDTIEDDKGNDTYIITDLESDTFIWDHAGKDKLIITTDPDEQCYLYFDVAVGQGRDNNGIVVWENGKTKFNSDFADASLTICNKSSLEAFWGGVTMQDFFGKGNIETININGQSIKDLAGSESNTMFDWIQMVEFTVQGWLTSYNDNNGTNFESNYDVISNGDEDAVAGLIGAYQNGTKMYLGTLEH